MTGVPVGNGGDLGSTGGCPEGIDGVGCPVVFVWVVLICGLVVGFGFVPWRTRESCKAFIMQ